MAEFSCSWRGNGGSAVEVRMCLARLDAERATLAAQTGHTLRAADHHGECLQGSWFDVVEDVYTAAI